MSITRAMSFQSFGRSHHLIMQTAEDLQHVLELDEAHWVATSAPTGSLRADATFLDLIDTDKNGRIICFEIRNMIRWLFDTLSDLTGVTEASTTLKLESINTETGDGQRIHQSVQKMLNRLALPDATEITLEQVRKIKTSVESAPVSEGGVALPQATFDGQIKQFIVDILSTVGGAPHPSGEQGVSQGRLDQFLANAQGFLAWQARGVIPEGETATDIMPLGAGTPAAFAALSAVRAKIDQYFAQCEALSFDPRVANIIAPSEVKLRESDFNDPASIDDMLKNAPLATPKPERILAVSEPLNPFYADMMRTFREQVAEPLLGGPVEVLSEKEWMAVKGKLAAYEAWVNSRTGGAVEPLGTEKLQGYLDEKFSSAVKSLIAESSATAFALDNIRLVEKLILYQANVLDLANNFVSFPHLYVLDRRAMFEMGTLVMDGRRFSFSVRVDNRDQHTKMAGSSNMYVLYAEITSRQDGEKREIAVPVTSGGKGNVCLGKRGLFIDVAGREWDAIVVHVIENPIGIWQAIVSPFKRLTALLTGKIESLTTAAEKSLDSAATKTLSALDGGPKPPAQQGSPGMAMGGLMMGGGVAIAALGSAAAYITKTLASMHWYVFVGGILGAILAVMLPSSIIALVKLRKRDLSSVLEACGWAINARMRLTIPLGRFFSSSPPYPATAKGVVNRRWWLILAVLVLLAVGGYFAYQRWWKPDKELPPAAPAVEQPAETAQPAPAAPAP